MNVSNKLEFDNSNNNRDINKKKDFGSLIVVEGIDGSGKSTQIHLLDRWLRTKGFNVFFTEWNSSAYVKEITSKGKKKRCLHQLLFLFFMQQILQIVMKEIFIHY